VVNRRWVVAIKALLSDPEFTYTGVGIAGDNTRLAHRDIQVEHFVDSATMAKQSLLISKEDSKKAGVCSLPGLLANFLRVSLPKDPAIRLSDWSSKTLTPAQIDYGCLDAYASVILFKFVLENSNL
jgi:hypothetical protein